MGPFIPNSPPVYTPSQITYLSNRIHQLRYRRAHDLRLPTPSPLPPPEEKENHHSGKAKKKRKSEEGDALAEDAATILPKIKRQTRLDRSQGDIDGESEGEERRLLVCLS
ncbi:hypothetical protein VNI00_017084 [Paramarasmius palmivorus]|uniref:DET1- and DDB1-associated protein 1 n=1 Tax=Paramarasmius palmivorus TaxID=297713 RepID=A0AAW0B8G9_9AGAR